MPSSPGRFIGAEKPATRSTGLAQRGHIQSAGDLDEGGKVEEEAGGLLVRARMQVLQN